MKLNLTNITKLIKAIKKSNMASKGDALDLTVGYDPKTGKWSYQTGDNSYTGAAYHYPVWGVTTIYSRSRSRDLAEEVLEQILDGAVYERQGL